MGMFELPDVIVLDNGMQFGSATVTDFCRKVRVQTKFVFIVHPHVTEQAESANRIISKGIKKILDDAKGL